MTEVLDLLRDMVLPVACVTLPDGGACVLEVAEVDGLLVGRADGAVVDLDGLVAVFGLPDLAAA